MLQWSSKLADSWAYSSSHTTSSLKCGVHVSCNVLKAIWQGCRSLNNYRMTKFTGLARSDVVFHLLAHNGSDQSIDQSRWFWRLARNVIFVIYTATRVSPCDLSMDMMYTQDANSHQHSAWFSCLPSQTWLQVKPVHHNTFLDIFEIIDHQQETTVTVQYSSFSTQESFHISDIK